MGCRVRLIWMPFANNTATIAVPDYKKTALLNSLLKKKYRFGVDYGDPDLVEQIIRMRRVKDTWEVSEMQRASVSGKSLLK